MGLRKGISAVFCILLIGTAFITGACSSEKNDGTDEMAQPADQGTIEKFDIYADYKENQLNSEYDETSAVKIRLSDSEIQVSGSGVVVKENTVTISKAGTYIVSGSVSDGQLIVDSSDTGYVQLVLDNVSITARNSSAIYVKNADNVLLTLPEGTENEVTDGEEYEPEDEVESLNAAIYSKDDLIINGSGNLTVTGNYNHGIQSKDDLVIISGNIQVHSLGDGIVGKDSVLVKEAVITIEAGGDGIKSTNAVQDKGYIYLDNPHITIMAVNDGIQAETCMVIENGVYDITTGGGSINAPAKQRDEFAPGMGKWDGGYPEMREEMIPEQETGDNTVPDSAKGFKAGVDITINGGSFTCDTFDDTIHSDNSITINNGIMTLASGDDGIHSDMVLTVNGGEIEIKKSYEGMESAVIYVNAGKITLTADDDGINAAGGSEASGMGGRNSLTGAGDYEMVFNGGTVLIYADGDGLDSNGKIVINGGTLWIEGPTDGGNSAVDYESGLEVNGGTFFAAGSAGMAEAPTGGSQYSIMINFDKVLQEKTEVTVRDSEGTGVFGYTPDRPYQSVIFSSPDLQKGNTYDILTNEEIYTSVMLSEIVTTHGTSGGMMKPGGRREHPGNREEGIREFPGEKNRETEGGI